MSYEYLCDPAPASIEDLLGNPILKMPFHDPSVTDLEYDKIFGLLYRSTYGDMLAAQDLRYAGRHDYSPRELMAYEYGDDSRAVHHNFTTFAHILNAIGVEEIKRTHRLTPHQKDVTLFSGGTHDAIEGVVGDVPRGNKTNAFKDRENTERWMMFSSVYAGILPVEFLQEADDVIAHRSPGIEHDYFELGHTLSQFSAGMRVSRICFMLMEVGFQLTPFPDIEGSDMRRRSMNAMAVEVTTNTAADLKRFADKGFWIAANALGHHGPHLQQIQDELGPLALRQ